MLFPFRVLFLFFGSSCKFHTQVYKLNIVVLSIYSSSSCVSLIISNYLQSCHNNSQPIIVSGIVLLLRSSADTRDSIILISLIMLRSLVGSSKINQYFVCLSNINRGPFFGRPCLFLLTIFIYLPLYKKTYCFGFLFGYRFLSTD